MAKRSPRRATTPAYPTLGEHLATRRAFLKTMGIGALVSTSSLTLVSCFSVAAPGTQAMPTTHRVRIPESGFAMAELSGGASLEFAVVASVETDATWDEGPLLAAAAAVFSDYTCQSLAEANPVALEEAVYSAIHSRITGYMDDSVLELGQCGAAE